MWGSISLAGAVGGLIPALPYTSFPRSVWELSATLCVVCLAITTRSKMGSGWSPFLNGSVVHFGLDITVYARHRQIYTLFPPILVS
jgi:hypothetical protein